MSGQLKSSGKRILIFILKAKLEYAPIEPLIVNRMPITFTIGNTSYMTLSSYHTIHFSHNYIHVHRLAPCEKNMNAKAVYSIRIGLRVKMGFSFIF